MGLDATVVYPTIDFRVKNPFDFPIVLHESVKNGVVRAEILGPKRTRTVTLIRKIDAAIPYEEVEREDPNLPDGVRVLSQRGVAGFKVHRYRIVRDGEHAIRERWNDLYPPTTQIVKRGTGSMPADSVKLSHDEHPEYLADELLVVTQGIDVGANEGEKTGKDEIESREPGKYGEAHWTQKEGMPYFEDSNSTARPEGEDPSAKKEPKKSDAKADANTTDKTEKKSKKKRK
jgi:hypothetical protein